jgi:alpha-beta hydrolase superfamily lysophospholipase
MNSTKWLHVLSIFLMLSLAEVGTASQEQLKPRGMAGFAFRAVTEADMDSLNLPDMNGMIVTRILPNTPAERAGLQVGDIVKKYDDNIILDDSQFGSVTRLYYAEDQINVSVIRDGKPILLSLTLEAFPEETSDEVKIEYTSFTNDGIRFRAVMISPLNSKKKKLPALLLVSALNSPRLIGIQYYNTMRELAYDIAKSGFRVMRFELRGYGDSEGEDYRTMDFETEVNDNLAALDYLMKRADVDNKKVFVMGHSTGGMVAVLLASKREVAGLITSCTIGRTFYERMVETLRLQNQLGGKSAAETDKNIKDYLLLTTLVARGDSLSAILEKNPDFSRFVNKSNRIMDDRSVEYWRQQLNLNLSEIYSKITAPVLIVYGNSDFLTQLACHEHIRGVLTAAGNQDVTLAVIPDLDHAYAYAKDKEESFGNYKTSNFRKNPAAVEKIIEWLHEHTERKTR